VRQHDHVVDRSAQLEKGVESGFSVKFYADSIDGDFLPLARLLGDLAEGALIDLDDCPTMELEQRRRSVDVIAVSDGQPV
jgi:hypothetical protein